MWQSRPLSKGIMNYRSSSMLEQAQNCVLTAAKLGHALIIAGKLDDAKSELERGRNINCPVDPILHHVEVNRESHIKEQLIAYTKKRIDSDLLYIDVSEEDGKFAMILRQLDKTRADDAHSVLKSAVDLASARPRSVRAQLLYPHIVLKLLVSGRLNDRSHDKSFSRALHILQDMSTLVPRSLVVSLLHAKLLVTLGHFDESEQECLRGLRIEMPDDPLSHDIPLASPSTDVAIYDDRVAQKRTQIACVLGTVVDMVKVEFSKLTEEQKGCFLAVKVTDLLDQSIAVMKVVEQYKFNNSWVLWRCQSEDCVFEAADPLALLLHLYGAHLFASDDDVEICYLTLCARLKSVHFVPLAGCHEDLYLARDSEGSDYVCVSSIESLFSGIHKVLSGLKGEEKEHIVSPVEALDRFMSHIVSDDEVVSDNALEESWRQLLASWAIDNRETLFELVANVKWLEMKKMVEKMIISMEIAGRDENEMPIEESLPEIKGPERSSGASNSQQQASRYAYGALHRRRAVVLPPPPSVETAKDADVYANGKTH